MTGNELERLEQHSVPTFDAVRGRLPPPAAQRGPELSASVRIAPPLQQA